MVRDPNRIPEILNKLAEVWKKAPDQRLGQLIGNAAGKKNSMLVEDDDIMKGLDDLSKRWN